MLAIGPVREMAITEELVFRVVAIYAEPLWYVTKKIEILSNKQFRTVCISAIFYSPPGNCDLVT